MKSRVDLGGLAVIGIFLLSVTAAQAGGGPGAAASFNTFFECQAIGGANVGEVVSTCNPGSTCTSLDGLIHSNVKVGNGVLLCRQVDVKNSAGSFYDPVPSDEMKCYSVNRPGQKLSPEDQVLSDAFLAETAVVSDQSVYLCAPVTR